MTDHPSDGPRYALYHAPAPGSPLERFGAAWLGRGVDGDRAPPRPTVPKLQARGLDLDGITRAPRQYGFHATLKAPFALAEGVDAEALASAVEAFAAREAPVAGPELVVSALGGFVALVPGAAAPAVDTFAARVVEAFEPFRAPLPASERARRLAGGLTDRQVALLDRWGYPFVFAEFFFHMTLTGRLAPDDADAVVCALAPLVASSDMRSLRIEALDIFHQPDRSTPFTRWRRVPLAG
ncbi:MAG: DUF1045 domain-containing protein [Azospirillaceae bacterium]